MLTDQDLPRFEIHQKRFIEQKTVFVLVHLDDFSRFRENVHLLSGFTKQEIALCRSTARGAQSIAARYAAKRGAEYLTGLPWTYFEILREVDSAPSLLLRECYKEALPLISSSNSSEQGKESYLNFEKKPQSKNGALPSQLATTVPQFLLSLTHDLPYAAAYLTLL